MKKFVIVAVSLLALGIFASTATASTGSFSRATVDQDWETANFAVSGTSSICSLGGCNFYPVVIAMPSLPSYRCGYGGEEFFDSDPDTEVVWKGATRTSDGPFSGEGTNVGLLYGLYEQKLCLALVGTTLVKDVVCEAQAPIFGKDPKSCAPVSRVFQENLASILPTVEVPAIALPPVVAPPPVAALPAPPKAKKPLKCPKGKKKVRRAGKAKCVKAKAKKRANK